MSKCDLLKIKWKMWFAIATFVLVSPGFTQKKIDVNKFSILLEAKILQKIQEVYTNKAWDKNNLKKIDVSDGKSTQSLLLALFEGFKPEESYVKVLTRGEKGSFNQEVARYRLESIDNAAKSRLTCSEIYKAYQDFRTKGNFVVVTTSGDNGLLKLMISFFNDKRLPKNQFQMLSLGGIEDANYSAYLGKSKTYEYWTPSKEKSPWVKFEPKHTYEDGYGFAHYVVLGREFMEENSRKSFIFRGPSLDFKTILFSLNGDKSAWYLTHSAYNDPNADDTYGALLTKRNFNFADTKSNKNPNTMLSSKVMGAAISPDRDQRANQLENYVGAVNILKNMVLQEVRNENVSAIGRISIYGKVNRDHSWDTNSFEGYLRFGHNVSHFGDDQRFLEFLNANRCGLGVEFANIVRN